MNAQQTQSVEIESIRDSVHTQLAAVTAQLDKIPAFGLKYGDTVAHIAIPLIIALFAFAFAYMFSVITRINQKYDSESISKMFKRSGSYRCYNVGSFVSILSVVLYGLCTLIPSFNCRPALMTAMSWFCFLMAGVYAFFILRFVHTCLVYDDHYSLLRVIRTRYKRKIKNPSSLGIRNDRLLGLCKYAVRIGDDRLFETILQQVNEYDNASKNYTNELIPSTLSFYTSMLHAFILTPRGGGMERSLFDHWLYTLKHYDLPNPVNFYFMLDSVVESVKRGQRHIYEAYTELCRGGYDYINLVPSVKYIIGEDVAVQKTTEDKGLIIWSELRETHFLAAAYLFSLGHYEVATLYTKRAGYQSDSFFPLAISEVFKLYVDCKAKQDLKSGLYTFSYWFYDNVIGTEYDRDILEKFTAMLLLVVGQLDNEGREIIIGEQKMCILLDSKEEIIKYGHLWQSHEELKRRFSQIRYVLIENQFEAGMTRLSDGFIEVPQPHKRGLQKRNIFELSLASAEKEPVQDLFDSLFNSNRSVITGSLEGDLDENKDKTIDIGAYSFLVGKSNFMMPDVWKDPRIEYDLTSVFSRRYLFVVYEAVSKMKINDIETTWNHFEHQFSKIVGQEGERYAIIDTNCYMKGFLSLDKPSEGESLPFPTCYKRAYYFDASSRMPRDLRKDVSLLNSFENTIVVISFSNLPALVPSTSEKAPIVSFDDESVKEKGWAAVRVTVDPCLVAKYREDAEVYRIRISH